jgi:hypothetical protein
VAAVVFDAVSAMKRMLADAHVSMQNLSKQNWLDSWFVCATFLEKSRAKSKSKKQRSWGALVREAAPFSRAAVATTSRRAPIQTLRNWTPLLS